MNEQIVLQSVSPIIELQMPEPPPAPSDEGADMSKRHYLEIVAAREGVPNAAFVIFERSALEDMMAWYKARQPLLINHDHGSYWSNKSGPGSVGYGQTTDARIEDGNLYVTAYIALGYDIPGSPLGSTDKIRDAVIDGFLHDASASIILQKGRCSICDTDYYDWDSCRHWRGEDAVVEDANGNKTVETCYLIAERCEAVELSLVWNGSDDYAQVSTRQLAMSRALNFDDRKLSFHKKCEPASRPIPLSRPPEPPPEQDNQTAPPSDRPQGEESMSTPTVEELQTTVNTLTVEKNQLELQVETLTNQLTVEQQRNTEKDGHLETQKKAFEKQIETLQGTITTQTESGVTKDNRIAELEKQIDRVKREPREAVALELYVAMLGEEVTDEAKASHEEFLKALPNLEAVELQIKQIEPIVAEKYPEGRQTVDAGEPEPKKAPKPSRRRSVGTNRY